ncbi:hypothetical protein [Deinococcus ruber]|uniref:hypothetical protein n=1 Tax=Deinococcus ruber TaxID=1848197 RepID=UPI0016636A59|nr:hypothetical protein [Deinococcus ruber]
MSRFIKLNDGQYYRKDDIGVLTIKSDYGEEITPINILATELLSDPVTGIISSPAAFGYVVRVRLISTATWLVAYKSETLEDAEAWVAQL